MSYNNYLLFFSLNSNGLPILKAKILKTRLRLLEFDLDNTNLINKKKLGKFNYFTRFNNDLSDDKDIKYFFKVII